MLFLSTRGKTDLVCSAHAITRGMADDGGLFVPQKFVAVPLEDIIALHNLSYQERAVKIISLFLTDYSEEELADAAARAYDAAKFGSCPAPVVQVNDNTDALELWHGPTSAFKDMALQILPLLLTKAIAKTGEQHKIVILTATSGDTGKAALEGFADVDGTEIIVFYPESGVSDIQKQQMVTQTGMDEYEFAVHETRTWEVIENVKFFKSEIGVLYLNDYNEQVMRKIFKEHGLEFTELFQCGTYVYLWGGHPLADRPRISMEELQDYPCLAFDQGKNGAFYFAEEMKSTYEYRQIIHANDRATLLNLMVGLNAYTLCSGIICEELNGSDYKAVPLVETEKMRIGYIKRKGTNISPIGEVYIRELEAYRERLL